MSASLRQGMTTLSSTAGLSLFSTLKESYPRPETSAGSAAAVASLAASSENDGATRAEAEAEEAEAGVGDAAAATVDVVVSRCDAPLMWLWELDLPPSARVFVYEKCGAVSDVPGATVPVGGGRVGTADVRRPPMQGRF